MTSVSNLPFLNSTETEKGNGTLTLSYTVHEHISSFSHLFYKCNYN